MRGNPVAGRVIREDPSSSSSTPLFVVVAMVFAYLAHGWLQRSRAISQGQGRFQEYTLLVYLALPLWVMLIRIFKVDQIAETLPHAWELALAAPQGPVLRYGVIALVCVRRPDPDQPQRRADIPGCALRRSSSPRSGQSSPTAATSTGPGRRREADADPRRRRRRRLSAFVAGAREGRPAEIVGILSDAPPGGAPECGLRPRSAASRSSKPSCTTTPSTAWSSSPRTTRPATTRAPSRLCELRGVRSSLLVETMDTLSLDAPHRGRARPPVHDLRAGPEVGGADGDQGPRWTW